MQLGNTRHRRQWLHGQDNESRSKIRKWELRLETDFDCVNTFLRNRPAEIKMQNEAILSVIRCNTHVSR